MPISTQASMIYRHVQTAAAAEWIIEHHQGSYPVVDVYIPFNGVVQKVLPQSIEFIDLNTVKVVFSVPMAGFATVLV
jgi:hypothetical protein